jgi:inner membrane protein
MWPGALILAAVASAIPDPDHNQSTAQSTGFNEIKENIPLAGSAVTGVLRMALSLGRKFLGKRGATHSFLICILLWWGLKNVWTSIPPPVLYAILAGYISHLIIDMFNPEGVRLFWPISFKITLAKILPWPFTFKTGSRIERFLFRPALWVFSMWIIAVKSVFPYIF